jgi:hypothetical protein
VLSKLALSVADARRERLERDLLRGKQSTAMRRQYLSRRGELHRPRTPHDQFGTDPSLKRGNRPAQPRLAHPQPQRRMLEMVFLAKHHEAADGPQIQIAESVVPCDFARHCMYLLRDRVFVTGERNFPVRDDRQGASSKPNRTSNSVSTRPVAPQMKCPPTV